AQLSMLRSYLLDAELLLGIGPVLEIGTVLELGTLLGFETVLDVGTLREIVIVLGNWTIMLLLALAGLMHLLTATMPMESAPEPRLERVARTVSLHERKTMQSTLLQVIFVRLTYTMNELICMMATLLAAHNVTTAYSNTDFLTAYTNDLVHLDNGSFLNALGSLLAFLAVVLPFRIPLMFGLTGSRNLLDLKMLNTLFVRLFPLMVLLVAPLSLLLVTLPTSLAQALRVAMLLLLLHALCLRKLVSILALTSGVLSIVLLWFLTPLTLNKIIWVMRLPLRMVVVWLLLALLTAVALLLLPLPFLIGTVL
ncbi:unnamed protein product, partial [Prorocentrum cordatum]